MSSHGVWSKERLAETVSSIRSGARLIGVKGISWLPDGMLQDAVEAIVAKIDEKPTLDITDTPANGEVLTYDSASGKYRPSAVAANAGQITNTPAGNIAATTVQAALNELDTEKATPSQIPAIASQAQADTGTDDTTIMTPLKVAARPQKNVVFETFIEGLALEWVSTTSVKVKTGAAWVPGASKIVNLAADATLVNTTNYTLAASKWYYVYLTDTGTITVVRDDGTNPTPVLYKGTARQQTSDANRRYLGQFKTSPASTIYKTQRKGNWVMYYEPVSTALPFGVLASGAATTATSVSCSAVVPITSTEAQCGIYNASATVYAYFSNSDIGTPSSTSYWLVMSPVTYAGAPLVLNSSQAFTYIMQAAGGQVFVVVQGYLEER